MNDAFSKLQLRKTFSYPFEGQGWTGKLALYVAVILTVFFIPILPSIILAGYGRLLMEKVILENGDPALPTWNDLGLLINKGWKVYVASVIYGLPALFFTIAGVGVINLPILISLFSQGFEIGPSSLGVSISHSFLADLSAIGSVSSVDWTGIVILVVMMVGMMLLGLGMMLGMVGGVARPVAVGHLIAKDKLSAAFKFSELWKVFRANWSGFVLTYLIQMGCAMILNIGIQILNFTMIFCCLIPFATLAGSAYISLVSYGLYARAYQQAQVNLNPNRITTVDS